MRKYFLLLATGLFLAQGLSAQNRIGDWQTFTNMMTVTQIQVIDSIVYAATNGGLLEYHPESNRFVKVTNVEGLSHTALQDMLVDENERLWLATGSPVGDINIWAQEGYVHKQITLDQNATVGIFRLTRDGGNIYGAARRNLDNIVVHYNRLSSGEYEYKDFYEQFPVDVGTINSIIVYQDFVYIATNNGLIRASVNAANLKDENTWEVVPETGSLGEILTLAINDGTLYFAGTRNVWAYDGNSVTSVPLNVNTSTIHVLQSLQGELFLGARFGLFRFNGTAWEKIIAESLPITAVDRSPAGEIWVGTEGFGIAHVNIPDDTLEVFQPNVPFSNEFSAVEVSPDGRLIAANRAGLAILEDGEWFNILNYPRTPNRTFISRLLSERGDDSHWNADTIQYRSSVPYDVEVREDNQVFVSHEGVSGFPSAGVLQISLDDVHNYQGYDTTSGHLSSSEGIGGGEADFLIIRDITLDNNDVLWIANAYAANGNALTAYTPNGEWVHFNVNDPRIQGKLNLLPTEIAVDQQNRIWVASTLKDADPKTNGGIAVLDFKGTLADQSDDRWYWLNKSINGLRGLTVFSITITSDNVAYVVTDGDKRVQKYRIPAQLPDDPSEIFFTTDRVDDFIGVFPLVESTKDYRDNIWFISANNGIKMRTSRGELLNDAQGYNMENSPLLSDNVHAITSDLHTGITYFATDFGISAVTTPYAEPRQDFSQVYTYPSPYYIPNEQDMVIAELPDETAVKILTVNGQVVKTLTTSDGNVRNRQAFWDGTNENGDLVGSGVYFLYGYTQDGEVHTTKALVIRR
ncbi:MAG: hypothetical protein K9N46_03830 [Candidatus Marinimicrobia bacterium]|nr:hypothetical protein [Candidatus Neomarinimicrobiota bacterium]MCF7828892.1 hypothetical protein [Candidatus Neomarinimicrobiota bacterium]MCF7879852.1 hypothetical protein [Candidatus Neomarinimicrobiota bacterium]